ncbi:hypothetical protein N0V95_002328 [Ascochyta clinopodiicola]|nr:hypothetical protein N0V95_002328 [Ascochyta clinopodiicola]
MRTTAVVSGALLAIVVAGAPVDLPKLPIVSLGLPSLSSPPTGVPSQPPKPVKSFPVRRAGVAVVDSIVGDIKLPTLPTLPKLPTGDKLPVKRADLPVAGGLPKDVKNPTLPKLPTDNLKPPVKRAELPVVDGLPKDVKNPTLPKLPVDNVNLPAKRADVPSVGDALKDSTIIHGIDPKVHLPLPVSTGLTKKATDHAVNAPINVAVDVLEPPTVALPAVKDLPKGSLQSREIEQGLPVVGGTDVPVDVGKLQVGTADKYVEDVAKGTTVKDLPVVGLHSRQIKQSLPVVGGVDIPLDAGKIQVGTVDAYVEDVVKGTTGL